MQKRKLSLSLLLASFLLLFSYSFALGQSVTFQDKTVPRCADVYMNVTIDNPTDLAAFEVIFEVAGDFSGFDVALDDALTGMDPFLDIDGNLVRIAGVKNDGCACLPVSGGQVIATLHFVTADVCDGSITVAGATVADPFEHGSNFVTCDPVAEVIPTVGTGTITIANQKPTIACPGAQTVHWGDPVSFTVTGDDPDLDHGCEALSFSVFDGPGLIDDETGVYQWLTSGDDVCDHTVILQVTDLCGDTAQCAVDICVYNYPPEFVDFTDTIFAVLGITLAGGVDASDPDDGPSGLSYSLVSFDGPTDFGTGLTVAPGTGDWTWDIADNDLDYTGDYTLCIAVNDGAEYCDPCSPNNADTTCIAIHVTGFFVEIECEDGPEGKGVLQGQNATVSINLVDEVRASQDEVGGFDFLVSYDNSALTAISAEPGDLIDDGVYEYFTYRHVDNCGGSCPTGMIRVVGMFESNNGITNPNPVPTGPGELAKINFYVTNDRTFECMLIPIRFYWIDCGDNTLSDVTGNILYLGLHVYDFEGTEITDPVEFGFSGPMANCYDTVSVDPFKAPLGAILFKDGCIKIICADSIDARGDINLNGITHEVADAVVFTNYFIYGMSAFTINPAGQTAASDVNADGIPLSVGDLVYLVRVIIGDALPIPKLSPPEPVRFASTGNVVSLQGNTEVGAALFVFDGPAYPSLADNASQMQIKQAYVDGQTRVLVYSMDGNYLTAGDILRLDGTATLVDARAGDRYGSIAEVEKMIEIPTEFALRQNYPNPFNPVTTIELALPVATDWNLAIYNVSGQKVAEFSGSGEAGTVQVIWDATNVASGLYFYKVQAGNFTDTKKMVLLK